MSFIIREGTINDMPSVLSLIKELAAYEREPNKVIVTVKDLERDGFGESPLFKTFVAERDNEIVGMALFYPRYSTWRGKTIHLEDLIVRENKRGLKIGSNLYKEVIKYGYQQKVKRIEWVVLDWNVPAIEFYKKTGADVLKGWETVQLDEVGIKNFMKLNSK